MRMQLQTDLFVILTLATEGPSSLFGVSFQRHAPPPPAAVTTTTTLEPGCP